MKKFLLATVTALALMATPALAERYDCAGYEVTFSNYSDVEIMEIYVKCVDCTEWSDDVLFDETIPPGYEYYIDLDGVPGTEYGYHVYNFYAKDAFGGEWTATEDLCLVSQITFQ